MICPVLFLGHAMGNNADKMYWCPHTSNVPSTFPECLSEKHENAIHRAELLCSSLPFLITNLPNTIWRGLVLACAPTVCPSTNLKESQRFHANRSSSPYVHLGNLPKPHLFLWRLFRIRCIFLLWRPKKNALEESGRFGGWRTSHYFQHSSHVQMLSQKLDSRISTLRTYNYTYFIILLDLQAWRAIQTNVTLQPGSTLRKQTMTGSPRNQTAALQTWSKGPSIHRKQSNPRESPSRANPRHNFRLIHHVKLRQGKQTSSKSWKGEVPFQCDNWHFTFCKEYCWMFCCLLNVSLQKERCKFLQSKVATNKETIQDSWHRMMHIKPNTIQLLNSNPNELHRTTHKTAAPFPGWCEFMNQNNQENNFSLIAPRTPTPSGSSPRWTQVKPTQKERKCDCTDYFLSH